MNPCKLAVITGFIGSGKSSVCDILKGKGYEIIDADKIAKDSLAKNSQKIAEIFGEEYIVDGSPDTKKLAALVFSDKGAKEKLEALLHPKIKERIYLEIERLSALGRLFFVDIPLYFESRNYERLRPVAVVYAPKEECIKRAAARDKRGDEDAIKKAAFQIDIEEKAKRADFIINNGGEPQSLGYEVDKFLEELEKWFCKNTAQAETIF